MSTMQLPTGPEPSVHRIQALRTALENFCDAVLRKDAASAQSWRDEALLRIPEEDRPRAKALILDYQIIKLEALAAATQALQGYGMEAAKTATSYLMVTMTTLARLEVEPR